MLARLLLLVSLACIFILSACKGISLQETEAFLEKIIAVEESEVNLMEVAKTLRLDVETSRSVLLGFESRLPQKVGWDVWRYQERAIALADFTLEHVNGKKWVGGFEARPAAMSYLAVESINIFEGMDNIVQRYSSALSEAEQLRYNTAREALEDAYQTVLAYRKNRNVSGGKNTVYQTLNLGGIGVQLARSLEPVVELDEPKEAITNQAETIESDAPAKQESKEGQKEG